MFEVKRTDKEIYDVFDICAEAEAEGSKFFGMTYEQGVEAGIRWVTKEGYEDDETPFS